MNEDYSLPVHRSLMKKSVMLGIGKNCFLIIVFLTGILACLTSFFSLIFGVIAFGVCRYLCKDEPFLIDFLIAFLHKENVYHA
jgi:type IV secretory pathway TrbD component